VFVFDDEGIVTFTRTETDVAREQLIEACLACPVDALIVIDDTGTEIVP
jgi:ferredoxin